MFPSVQGKKEVDGLVTPIKNNNLVTASLERKVKKNQEKIYKGLFEDLQAVE